jgi:restriction endonuclease S subunit
MKIPPTDQPKVRFPEFTQPWPEQDLDPFILEHKEKSAERDQHRVMTSSNNGLMWQDEYYGGGRIVERNNVGFNVLPPSYITYRSRSDTRAFTFNINVLGETGLISHYYPVFSAKEMSSIFLVTLLNSKKQTVGRYSVGTSQTVLSLNALRRIKLPIPALPEQRKIADFLTAVDGRIGQLIQKKALLVDYKKGVMQQLFTQAIRFKDDHGNDFPDWEEKKLGDVLVIGSGRDYKHLNEGTTPVYGSGGVMTYVDDQLYEGESVCIGRKGTIDKPLFLTGSFWTVDTLFYTHSFKEALPRFVYAIFQQINWRRYNEASGVPSLSKSTIEKIPVSIPHPDEQTKIADFLSAIDLKIESVASQIIETQTFKCGLLQQMFV